MGERPNITANLRVPGTLDFDDWLGVSPGRRRRRAAMRRPGAGTGNAARRPASRSISPALRAFDATLNLETSAIEVASLKVDYADLQARLRNGVFTITKLTGQFYGGAVDFNGTVDATKDTLAVDLKGSLQGIYFGEMLRGTAGTNTFGNENLKVAVDGKINVMDISVHGSGRTTEEIRNSLSGRGQVSGYALSRRGQRFAGLRLLRHRGRQHLQHRDGLQLGGAVGLHQPPEHHRGRGHARQRHGVAHNHTVQGQNAVATITSRTSLAAATTDTTIALDTGRRGPADYVVTVKGPVSSPTMTTRGGN